jgi:hypothetical protein
MNGIYFRIADHPETTRRKAATESRIERRRKNKKRCEVYSRRIESSPLGVLNPNADVRIARF